MSNYQPVYVRMRLVDLKSGNNISGDWSERPATQEEYEEITDIAEKIAKGETRNLYMKCGDATVHISGKLLKRLVVYIDEKREDNEES